MRYHGLFCDTLLMAIENYELKIEDCVSKDKEKGKKLKNNSECSIRNPECFY
jgi:hypothetical protein